MAAHLQIAVPIRYLKGEPVSAGNPNIFSFSSSEISVVCVCNSRGKLRNIAGAGTKVAGANAWSSITRSGTPHPAHAGGH